MSKSICDCGNSFGKHFYVCWPLHGWKHAYVFCDETHTRKYRLNPTPPDNSIQSILDERKRQHEKWGEQNHDMMTWIAILHEETGELAEACLHKKFGGPESENIHKEAVQVAAVALQIVQFLDR